MFFTRTLAVCKCLCVCVGVCVSVRVCGKLCREWNNSIYCHGHATFPSITIFTVATLKTEILKF